MQRPDWRTVLDVARARSIDFLESLPDRPVRPVMTPELILAAVDRPVPEESTDPARVVEDLATAADPGIMAMPSGRFFGWVIGGALPASLAADWLTGAWDQPAGSPVGTPAAAAVEQVAIRWVLELLGLPRASSAALVTGAQMANFTCLAAARFRVLATRGWDVGADGLFGAPEVHVFVGAERHDTVDRALRYLGFGARRLHVVEADPMGRMQIDALARAVRSTDGPVIVCAQVGNVNGGGIDPVAPIADLIEPLRAARGAWLHVDGAFGLWARASPELADRVRGVERADSWATDAHKWLNTPYDSGIAMVADAEAHLRAMSIDAAYLPRHTESAVRTPYDYTPELSRRARGFALYAAIHQLGRRGVADLVERCCRHARAFAERIGRVDGVELMNEVVLNQVVVRFHPASGGDADAHTLEVVRRVQEDGTCFVSGTTWRGASALRISVSNWSTDDEDVDRAVAAIERAHRS